MNENYNVCVESFFFIFFYIITIQCQCHHNRMNCVSGVSVHSTLHIFIECNISKCSQAAIERDTHSIQPKRTGLLNSHFLLIFLQCDNVYYRVLSNVHVSMNATLYCYNFTWSLVYIINLLPVTNFLAFMAQCLFIFFNFQSGSLYIKFQLMLTWKWSLLSHRMVLFSIRITILNV